MPRQRECDECGNTYSTKSPASKYCGPGCRSRVSRRPGNIPAHLGHKALDSIADNGKPSTPAAPIAPLYDSLADQIQASLNTAQAMDTISGMAALRVAQQIDRGGDSGSAVATLTKELSRLVAEAKVEAAPRIKDAVDDVASAVIAKLQGLSA